MNQVTCEGIRVNARCKRPTCCDLPYVLDHLVYVNHGASASIPMTFPIHGNPGGPGGKERDLLFPT